MNREILFRGKRVDNGKWVKGSHLSLNIGKEYICDGTVWIGTLNPCKYDIIPETVGQYTGLTDKNGKKIFEGDIVEYHSERYVIKYLEKYMRFSPSNFHAVFAVFDYTQSEIIGNIHDNPELLKEDNNA